MIVHLWQGRQWIGRCPELECGREEIRAHDVDTLKTAIRRHLRQFHGIRAEPTWKGP